MKTRWVELTVVAYRVCAVEVQEGTEDAMKAEACKYIFDNPPNDYELEETINESILPEEPDDRHCRNHDVEKFPMDESDKEEV